MTFECLGVEPTKCNVNRVPDVYDVDGIAGSAYNAISQANHVIVPAAISHSGCNWSVAGHSKVTQALCVAYAMSKISLGNARALLHMKTTNYDVYVLTAVDVNDEVTVAAREALGATAGKPLVDTNISTSESPFVSRNKSAEKRTLN